MGGSPSRYPDGALLAVPAARKDGSPLSIEFTILPIKTEDGGLAGIAAFLRDRASLATRHYQLVPTRANSQPAFGCYVRDAQAPIARAHGVMVLTLEGNRISMMTRFLDNAVLPHFGLPRTLRG